MKSLVLKMIMPFLKLTKGVPFKNIYSGKVQILMLHRVVDNLGKNRISNDGIEITTTYLEHLIEFYLKNKFIPISINDFVKITERKDKRRYVVFSFDDGYYDNYEKALPVFAKYKVPFAVYISTDFIHQKQFAWWYFLEDIISANKYIKYTDGKEGAVTMRIETKSQKELVFVKMREAIQNNNEVLNELIGTYKPDLVKYYNLFLNMKQLRLLANHPLVTIGSHSLSHPSLAKCSNEESFEEIFNSKKELERIIGKPVVHFSYPFGTSSDVGQREIKNVEKAGYLTALTTRYGDVYINKNINLFSLPRIWTSSDNDEDELVKCIYGINAYRRKNV